MAGVVEFDDEAGEVEGLFVVEGFEEGDGLLGIVAGVEGLDFALPGFLRLLVEVGGVFFTGILAESMSMSAVMAAVAGVQ